MKNVNSLPILNDDELPAGPSDEAGFGALVSSRGALPLAAMTVRANLCGLTAEVLLEQTFVNTTGEPIEATYLFPLPDRAAVTAFRMKVGERVIEGELKERAAARREYDEALVSGYRAAIAEENRPDVFGMRVGNLLPGDVAVVSLTLVGPLLYEEGEATFRFPLVVAPRYIPGTPLSGPSVGPGTVLDTTAVPDASLITPPVLLPGFPNPVKLELSAVVEPGGLKIGQIRSSLHAVVEQGDEQDRRSVRIQPGERLNRDFILRMAVEETSLHASVVLRPDAKGDEGTFLLTLVPPQSTVQKQRPRDVVLLLDRSGSMQGWKMVAARRAAARIIDTLLPQDRFDVLAFDETVESPNGKEAALVAATDRNRFRAVEFLSRLDARGGTELAQPLAQAVASLSAGDPGRDRVLVLVTDGQVGNEDQLLATLGAKAREMRVFTLGIDQAVNAGFLQRLACLGGGACDLVESEDRLDEVLTKIHHRIGTPLLSGVQLESGELKLQDGSLSPARLPDLFPGVPLTVMGRYQGKANGSVEIRARDGLGQEWSQKIGAISSNAAPLAPLWARGHIRDLEDQYASMDRAKESLEKRIIATSLRFSVLSRFTAFVAVDRSLVVNACGEQQKLIQPVEMPEGWEKGARLVRKSMASFAAGAVFCDAEMDQDSMAFSMPTQGYDYEQVRLKLSSSLPPRASKRERRAAPKVAVDLASYRSRVAQWLQDWLPVSLLDQAAQRQFLLVLQRDIKVLLDDLRSVGAPSDEIDSLKKLFLKLVATLGAEAPDDAEWTALREQLEKTCAAFAQVRPAFWK
ncbi:MAG: VIT domain-containing protein [Pirellulaceae bacterium]